MIKSSMSLIKHSVFEIKLLVIRFYARSCHQLVNHMTFFWEEFFHCYSPTLTPRLRRHIANIDLLHKTKEETRLDRQQRRGQEAEPDDNNDDKNSRRSRPRSPREDLSPFSSNTANSTAP